jgi:hypothetical protein
MDCKLTPREDDSAAVGDANSDGLGQVQSTTKIHLALKLNGTTTSNNLFLFFNWWSK